MKFRMLQQPPCIRCIKYGVGSFRIGLPELHYYSFEYGTFSCPYLKLPDNSYAELRTGPISSLKPDAPEVPDNDKLPSIPFENLQINRNLSINSFEHWQELTEQNPHFFQEQFDPLVSLDVIIRCIHQPSQTIQALPDWMIEGNCTKNISAKIFAAKTRSISCEGSRISFLGKLSLPILTIVNIADTNDFLGTKKHQLLCLIHTTNNNYIPFYLPNVSSLGTVCMGCDYSDDADPFEYFWNSKFDALLMNTLFLNPNLSIRSVRYWQELTQRNPDFFREEFDPIYSEKMSPVIYQIEDNTLSWKFGTR